MLLVPLGEGSGRKNAKARAFACVPRTGDGARGKESSGFIMPRDRRASKAASKVHDSIRPGAPSTQPVLPVIWALAMVMLVTVRGNPAECGVGSN